MKALKYILFLLLIGFIGLAIFVAVQPNEFNFSRSKVIKAPTSLIFNKVNNYKNWSSFSPWIELDPEATLTYGEKTSGIDGNYAWNGKIIGKGNMKTIDLEPNKTINQQIRFIKPFESESDINWIFETTEEGTKVTWNMTGKQDFSTKMYTTFFGSIEKNTAPSFERGLFKLDSVIKAGMKKYNIKINGISQHSGGYYLYNTTSCKITELEAKTTQMLSKVLQYATKNNINIAGAPYINYHKWDKDNNAAMFSCCIPTTEKIDSSESDILTGQLPPFKAVKTTLKGDYDNLKEAWDKTMKYIQKNNLELTENGPMLETYLTNPNKTENPAEYITEIFIAVK